MDNFKTKDLEYRGTCVSNNSPTTCRSVGLKRKSGGHFRVPTSTCQTKIPRVNDGSVRIEDNVILLKKLKEDLAVKGEKLRRLELVKYYHRKHNLSELSCIIKKWKDACREALPTLLEKINEQRMENKVTMEELLKYVGLDYQLIGYNIEDESFD